MTHWVFVATSVLVFTIAGSIVPILFMMPPSMLTSSTGVGLIAFLIIPTAYMLGGLVALVHGVVFAAVASFALVRLPRAWLSSRLKCLAWGVLLGVGVATIPVAVFWTTSRQLALILFLVPSVICGGGIGLFLVPKFVLNKGIVKKAIL